MTAHTDQTERMTAWHGLRPSTAAPCPARVAGRRCRAYRAEGCVCDRHRWMLDHARMWRDADGALVLTAEPYNRGGADVAAFIADMAALGLDVTIHGRSPWNPGATFLLTIRPARRTP